ncbi:helix-turn-helix transcriptional regulator [Streptomyces oceani]|uniref:helix-turn-helix transcriptional regulator n=1 Tax=Streptomyces oceani TaxID=1075402 RepID=UPI001BAEF140|nr:AraC family transcriptional regulator [Streptomyces oceani]
MSDDLLQFADHAPGLPYHAALVMQSSRISEQHGHADFFEFMALISGSGRQLSPDGEQRLAAGDVVLVRPRDRHALQGAAPGGMEFVNIAFPTVLWRGFSALVGAETVGGWEEPVVPPIWRLRGEPAGVAAEVFQRALDRYQDQPAMFDLMRFWTDVTELVTREAGTMPGVSETAAPAAGQECGAGRQSDWLHEVCAAMGREENLRGGLPTMRSLAAVSPAHLSRSVRAHFGITPTEYVTELRLRRAAELLSATSEPVTAIAQRCGFASQSYFTRCFRAAHGMSPREYRQRAWRAFVP